MNRFWKSVLILMLILPVAFLGNLLAVSLGCSNPIEQGCSPMWLELLGGLSGMAAWIGVVTFPLGFLLACARIIRYLFKKQQQ